MHLTALYEARVAAGEIRADPAQHAVLPLLDALGQWIEGHALRKPGRISGFFGRPEVPPKGVYLWGGVGRGKSMLMDMFLASLSVPATRRVHFHAFMQQVHHGMHRARKDGIEDPLAPVAEAVAQDIRLLALDEVQITDITDAMIVGRLFQMLMDQGVVLIATSNRAPEGLYENGLNRALFLPFIALIRARMTVHHLESPTDYRQHRLSGTQVWLQPASTARATLDALWSDLTGGAPGAALDLAVNGRVVSLPQFANGIARASFWDLCARPLGPADYLAIAGAVRVLILEDIPQLSSGNYNEAKRFVTLIDTLYEAKVRLICSAAEVPERLYIEGTGSFEFERTASRLREMQGAGWGA
jgi:cell division protein ZapE